MSLIVEDGNLVSGADSYESLPETLARLQSLGLTFLATKEEVEQEGFVRLATVQVEGILSGLIDGRKVMKNQARLYPRLRSFDERGVRIGDREIPEALKMGVSLRAEDLASGRIRQAKSHLSEEAGEGHKLVYRHRQSFSDESPLAWKWLRQLWGVL